MFRRYSYHELLVDDTNRVFAIDSDLEEGNLIVGLLTVFPYVNSPVRIKDNTVWIDVELPQPMVLSRSPITTSEANPKVLNYGYFS